MLGANNDQHDTTAHEHYYNCIAHYTRKRKIKSKVRDSGKTTTKPKGHKNVDDQQRAGATRTWMTNNEQGPQERAARTSTIANAWGTNETSTRRGVHPSTGSDGGLRLKTPGSAVCTRRSYLRIHAQNTQNNIKCGKLNLRAKSNSNNQSIAQAHSHGICKDIIQALQSPSCF